VYIVYYNIATIGIGIFQFHKEIVNNLVFWIIFHFFLLIIFFVYVVWFQMIWNCQACSQLALKNESIELQAFWKFFHNDLSLRSAAARIFAVTKKGCLLLQILISCNLHGGNFWIFFHIFSNQCLTRSYSYMCQKLFFFQKFATCPRNGSFRVFLVKI